MDRNESERWQRLDEEGRGGNNECTKTSLAAQIPCCLATPQQPGHAADTPTVPNPNPPAAAAPRMAEGDMTAQEKQNYELYSKTILLVLK
jgi:hypothetical protein